MSTETATQFEELQQAVDADAALDKLISILREQNEYHKLFDAKLMKKKHELGLPLVRPTSFDDVPDDKRDEFEECYVEFAREIGQTLLSEDKLSEAWMYFRTIKEPESVAAAIEQMSPRMEADEKTEEIINIALYEGANPVKGLEFMLTSHGTCNTITALDQQMPQLSVEDRKRAAAMMVKNIYDDLCHTLNHEVQQRLAMSPPSTSLRELMAGRDWLFEEGNYHIDVSHLNSVVRFARSLDGSNPEIEQAIELAEYGSKLDQQFQYGGDPPFDDFYPAHIHFLKALAGTDQEESVAYFQAKLDQQPEEADKQMVAYVMVDLLNRIDKMDQALDLAQQHLKDVDESTGFSFAELCLEAGRLDTLQQVAKEKGDLVSYTAALIQGRA